MTIMTANSQVVILWHANSSTRSTQKSFSFVIATVQLQPITSHQSPNIVNTLVNVKNQWMIVRWSWILVKLSIISKFVMTAPPLRNYFRQWLTVQSRVMGTRLNLEEPRSEASFVKRPDHWLLQPGLNQTSTRKTIWEPCQTCQTCRATVRGECYGPNRCSW